MIIVKEKITLSKEKETLLIPLYCKAKESKKENPIITDSKALEIINNIDYNFSELKVPNKTCITLNIRAKKIDEYVVNFINKKEKNTIIHLGCGLDNRIGRINKNVCNWYDLDFEGVIKLRKDFYNKKENYHFISSSVTDHSWVNNVDVYGNVLIIAEGLLMYLKEDEVKNLFQVFNDKFSKAKIIFDAYSKYTVKNISKHASVKKTGAEIFWGIDDPHIIENWNDDYKLIEEWYFTDYGGIQDLPVSYRLAFKVAGLFDIAKKAHRVLYYQI